jgi:hypothetical protein
VGSKKREPARRQTPSSPLAYLPHAFALLAILAAIAHFRTQIDSNDEGIATMGAWRVLSGQVPYRDFFAIETPLSFYLVAPLYKLFGTTFEVGRVVTQAHGISRSSSLFSGSPADGSRHRSLQRFHWLFFVRPGSGCFRLRTTIGSPTCSASLP